MLMRDGEIPDSDRDAAWELFCTILLTILKSEMFS